jgi:hypothetical protein
MVSLYKERSPRNLWPHCGQVMNWPGRPAKNNCLGLQCFCIRSSHIVYPRHFRMSACVSIIRGSRRIIRAVLLTFTPFPSNKSDLITQLLRRSLPRRHKCRSHGTAKRSADNAGLPAWVTTLGSSGLSLTSAPAVAVMVGLGAQLRAR